MNTFKEAFDDMLFHITNTEESSPGAIENVRRISHWMWVCGIEAALEAVTTGAVLELATDVAAEMLLSEGGKKHVWHQ